MNKSLTIRKRIRGRGGGGEVQKQIYSRKGKLEKIRAIQVTLKIFIHWSKRIHAREINVNEKRPCDSKIPHPPQYLF